MAVPDLPVTNPSTPADKNRHVIPMPSWSTYIGCTKLILSVLILAFSAVCLHIWTTQTAFVLTLVTALVTLFISAYYAVALSCSTRLYHGFAVLLLECTGTALWAASTILLATWTHQRLTHDWMGDVMAGEHGGKEYLRHLRKELTPAKVASEHFRTYAGGRHVAVTRLAGVSAGFAGLLCLLFLVTLAVFARNLREHLKQGGPLTSEAGINKMARTLSVGSVESMSRGSQVLDVDKEQNERDRRILEPEKDEFVDVTKHLHQGGETR